MNAFGSNLVPLGLQDGKLRFVDEVAPGLACGCICPSCEQPLVARSNSYEGRKRRPHFAHYSKGNCPGGFESAIHKAAKELLTSGQLTLPDLHLGEPIKHRGEIIAACIEPSVQLAQRRQPDVVVNIEAAFGTFELLVEICNHHRVDSEKQRQYRGADLACIEIDVRNVPPEVFAERASFEARVRDAAQRGRWVAISPNAIRALLGAAPVKVEIQSSSQVEVPFATKKGEPMSWLVQVQQALEWTPNGWTPVSLELEQMRHGDVWCDGTGTRLPYSPGLYLRSPALARFKQRLSPLHVAWDFPGEPVAVLI